MPKYFKFIFLFFLAFLIFLLQASFFNSLPGLWGRINLPLLFVISLFIFYNFKNSLYLSLFLGLFLDLFSFYFFGIYTISFLLTLFLADFVWANFFTNRSIYSFLILGAFLSLFYNFILYLFLLMFEKNSINVAWFGKYFWLNLGREVFWVILLILIFFYFLNRQKGRSGGLSFEKKSF
jgi:cell shape-determining protein MreD